MKDSIGNELPMSVMLCGGATSNEIDQALAVNTFLIAAEAAMERGRTVIYSAESKRATVQAENGIFYIISHV